MASTVTVRRVANKKDLKTFIHLPWKLYADDPNWVPPLLLDHSTRLNRKKNPFFRHSDAEYFLAFRGEECVGRIAAIHNRRHIEVYKEQLGFFGWFECVDDEDVATALFCAAEEWLAERGLVAMRGPASFSLNDECGILIEGFERPPTIMTNHNPRYYEKLLASCGFDKSMDLYSFSLPVMTFNAERIGRIVEKVKKRENLRVRPFDLKNYDQEVIKFKELYNDAWTDNWGFVPLTDEEIDHMAKDLKPIIVPELAVFVEVDDRPVGFSLVVPDVNVILKRLNGRLLPFGIFKLLFGLKKVTDIRLIAMGISREYQHRGIDSVLYYEAFRASRDLGKIWSELGWVLETNKVMVNTIEKIGGERHKTHRLYERHLATKI